MDDEPGIGREDLPEIYHEGYLQAVESARAEHDPADDWAGFREYLWQSLVRVFGLDVDVPWPDEPAAMRTTRST